MTSINAIYVNELVDGEMILNDYTPCELKNVKLGEFFTVKAGAKAKYVKGEYDRSDKKYACMPWQEGNYKMLKGTTIVYIGFTY